MASQWTSRHGADALSDRLRRDGAECRPEFSEALHAKIMAAVRQCRRDSRSATRPVPAIRLRGWTLAAVAATMLLVLVASWRPWRPLPAAAPRGSVAVIRDAPPEALPETLPEVAPEETSDAVGLEPVSELADRAVEQLGELADSALSAGQWAFLDDDARSVVKSLARQLPLELASSETAEASTTADPFTNQ